MKHLKMIALGILIIAGAPSVAAGQSSPSVDVEDIRAMLIHGFEMGRMMDVEFARAIPDSAVRWAPTEGVRTFTGQVAHGGIENTLFASMALGVERPPRDTAVYLNDKEALVEALNQAYDWVIEGLQAMPAEQFLAETELFGQTMPVWRAYLQSLEHGYWTRGQMVPYYRLNSVKPPRYRAF